MNTPLISIITVVYNSEKYIEGTLKSIQNQTCKDFEYIIIDGDSKDNTLSIIQRYQDVVSKLISETDKGLYDAMNKGLQMAKGQFVWFINSGDKIYADNTVENIVNLYADNPTADIFYGQTQLIDENDNILGMRKKTAPDKLNKDSLKMGLMVCHQSILVKKTIADNYNLQLKVAADYLWVLSALEKAHNIVNTRQILSRYLENGFSANNQFLANRERMKVMIEHYGLWSTLVSHVKITFRYLLNKIKEK